MKNLLVLGGVLVAAMASAGAATASDPITTPLGQEGCASVPNDTCTYTATRDGGYAARGDNWTFTVAIPVTPDDDPLTLPDNDGWLTYTYGPGNAPPQGCGLWSPGAKVTTAAGASSGIAAGNPFPAASDGSVSNTCSTGKIPDNTYGAEPS